MFASDQEIQLYKSGTLKLPEQKKPSPDAKKIAIIGGGPAGSTAAGDLADKGFAVTLYEARDSAGGMLYCGIPRYRLPKEILDYEVELIKRKGVTIHLNCSIGKDKSFSELKKEHDAVFTAAGITHEQVWIQHLPQQNQDFVVASYETSDPKQSFKLLATSTEPWAVKFR